MGIEDPNIRSFVPASGPNPAAPHIEVVDLTLEDDFEAHDIQIVENLIGGQDSDSVAASTPMDISTRTDPAPKPRKSLAQSQTPGPSNTETDNRQDRSTKQLHGKNDEPVQFHTSSTAGRRYQTTLYGSAPGSHLEVEEPQRRRLSSLPGWTTLQEDSIVSRLSSGPGERPSPEAVSSQRAASGNTITSTGTLSSVDLDPKIEQPPSQMLMAGSTSTSRSASSHVSYGVAIEAAQMASSRNFTQRNVQSGRSQRLKGTISSNKHARDSSVADGLALAGFSKKHVSQNRETGASHPPPAPRRLTPIESPTVSSNANSTLPTGPEGERPSKERGLNNTPLGRSTPNTIQQGAEIVARDMSPTSGALGGSSSIANMASQIERGVVQALTGTMDVDPPHGHDASISISRVRESNPTMGTIQIPDSSDDDIPKEIRARREIIKNGKKKVPSSGLSEETLRSIRQEPKPPQKFYRSQISHPSKPIEAMDIDEDEIQVIEPTVPTELNYPVRIQKLYDISGKQASALPYQTIVISQSAAEEWNMAEPLPARTTDVKFPRLPQYYSTFPETSRSLGSSDEHPSTPSSGRAHRKARARAGDSDLIGSEVIYLARKFRQRF